jgi:hypothetical protein
VIAIDVDGIDPSQVVGYMVAAGWTVCSGPAAASNIWTTMRRGRNGQDVPMMSGASDYTRALARMVNELAEVEERPGLDIVDAIRATEVTP